MGVAPAYGDEKLLTADTLRRYQDMMRAPGVRAALMERMRQSRNSDPVPRLQTLKMPVLLVWGEKDAFIPISHAQDYLESHSPRHAGRHPVRRAMWCMRKRPCRR